jgi:hypothetical protein
MADRRELILVRLKEILESIADGKTVARNRGEFEERHRPAYVLLDGSEVTDPAARNRGRQVVIKNLVQMQPQIFFLADIQKPDNETIGTLINTERVKIIKAIGEDQQLRSIVGTNGGIDYLGCETDMETGRSMQGEIQLNFEITYVLNPSEL